MIGIDGHVGKDRWTRVWFGGFPLGFGGFARSSFGKEGGRDGVHLDIGDSAVRDQLKRMRGPWKVRRLVNGVEVWRGNKRHEKLWMAIGKRRPTWV